MTTRRSCPVLVLVVTILLFVGGHETSCRGEEKENVSTKTPQECFAAYAKALREKEWRQAYAMMTPEQRDFQLFELAFGLGMTDEDELVEKHQDPERRKKFEAKAKREAEVRARAEEQGKPIDLKRKQQEEIEFQRDYVALFKDKEEFYSAAMQTANDRLRDDLPDGKLRNVEIKGGRARGTTTQHIESLEKKGGKVTKHRHAYESPVYFKKEGNRWLLDVPTAEEARRDAAQLGADEE